MNDFTKEELQMILSDLEHAVFSRFYAEGKAKLREKIQFMIDNYQEETVMVRGEPRSIREFCGE